MDFQEIIAGTVGKDNTFGTCRGSREAGAMSFARFSTDDTAGVMRGYVGEGAFTNDPLNTFGGVGVVQIPDCRNCCTTSAKTALSITWRQISQPSPRPFMKRPVAISDGRCTGTELRVRDGHRCGSRFRHLKRARLVRGQRAWAPGIRDFRISSSPQARRSRLRHPVARDHMRALAEATRQAVQAAGITGEQVEAIALDTTGSSVIPVGEGLVPLDDYYLWCDHRAKQKPQKLRNSRTWNKFGSHSVVWRRVLLGVGICQAAALAAPQSGQARTVRQRLRALRHGRGHALRNHRCPKRVKRSVCAMGHKWMWNPSLGGLPPESFLAKVDPLLAGVRSQTRGEYATSDKIAGTLSPQWAEKLGLRAGHPHSRSAPSTHTGTRSARRPRRRCGQRRGHLDLHHRLCRAGAADPGSLRSGAGQRASAIHRHRSWTLRHRRYLQRHSAPRKHHGRRVEQRTGAYGAGQTGLLRMTWDNGDRTVLVNPNLGGMTLGWNLMHTAQDELFAAIEGTAFHTRIILDRMTEYGAPTQRVINGGGIPQNNPVLNQVYANVLGRPVLVPSGKVTGSRFRDLCIPCGQDVQDRSGGARQDLPRIPSTNRRRTRRKCTGNCTIFTAGSISSSADRSRHQRSATCCRS